MLCKRIIASASGQFLRDSSEDIVPLQNDIKGDYEQFNRES